MKTRLILKTTVITTAFCVTAAGCGYTQYKNPGAGAGITAPGVNTAGGPPPGGPSPTGASTPVTFTQVSQQILQTQCISCHSGSQAPDLASYAGFATNTTYVVPGNPSASAIYTAVQSGVMPKGGSPLSPAELTLLADWIQQGALND